MRTRLLTTLACAAALVPVADAAAAPDVRKVTWRVTLEGRQTTSWTLAHTADPSLSCDVDQSGSGSETVRFRSRPARVYAYTGIASPVLFGRGKRGTDAVLQLAGSVQRQGTVTSGVADLDNCPDGIPALDKGPDCGTTRFTALRVTPVWDTRGRRVSLEQQDPRPADPFERCPVSGPSFPDLLTQTEAGNPIGRVLPFRDLLADGQSVVLAKGTTAGDSGDVRWTSSVRWTLDFKRVKREVVGR